MRIKRIRAQNYRQYGDLDLTFPDSGLFGIVGPNGSGKSTLAEILRFASYGVEACRTVKDGIARVGADGPTWVEVSFASATLGNVVVRRELDGEATVAVNGSLVAKSPRGVTAYMAKLLGMDLRAWRLSYECPQKELDGFGRLGPAQRREQLLRWLGILRLDKVLERVRSDGKTAKASWEGLSAGLPDIEDLERRIGEATGREADLAASVDTLRTAAEAKRTELDAARACADQLAATAATDARLAGEIVALETRQATTEQRRAVVAPAVEELRALSASQEALAGATSALGEKRQELRGLTEHQALRATHEARLQRAEAAVTRLTTDVGASREPDHDALTTKLTEADEALGAAEAELSTVSDETTRASVELDSARREIEAALARYRRLEALGADAPCPTCEQPLGEKRAVLLETVKQEGAAHRKVSDALAEALKDLQRRKTEAADRVGLARAAQRLAQQALEAGRLASHTRAGLVSQLKQAESERDEARAAMEAVASVDAAAIKTLQDEIAALEVQERERQRNAGRLEGLLALEKELAELLRAAIDIAAELDTKRATRAYLGNDPLALAAAQTVLTTAQAASQSAALDLQRAESDRVALGRELEAMRAQLADAIGRKDAAEAARVKAVRLGTLSERFAGFRDHLVSRIRPTLSALASELFVEIVDGRYEALELTDDYAINITDRGVVYPLERFSGGEEDQAALALRLAVARQLAGAAASPAQFLLLDEPFTSFDSERLAAALSGLRRLQNVFPQIFVVSHLDALKDAATAMFTVEEGPDGRSTAVRSDVEQRAAA